MQIFISEEKKQSEKEYMEKLVSALESTLAESGGVEGAEVEIRTKCTSQQLEVLLRVLNSRVKIPFFVPKNECDDQTD